MLTVADVYAYVNGRAPFDTQMDFDNAGCSPAPWTNRSPAFMWPWIAPRE